MYRSSFAWKEMYMSHVDSYEDQTVFCNAELEELPGEPEYGLCSGCKAVVKIHHGFAHPRQELLESRQLPLRESVIATQYALF